MNRFFTNRLNDVDYDLAEMFVKEFGHIIKDGKANATTMENVALKHWLLHGKLSKRRLRMRIHIFRMAGIPILSTSTGDYKGYFLAANHEEIRGFKAMIRSRIRHEEEIIANL